MRLKVPFQLRISVFVCAVMCFIAPLALSAQTATTTTLAITSGNTSVTTVSSGTVVTLTATVTGSAGPLTVGQVKFCDATAAHCEDIHILGTAQLTSVATATYKFRPGVGSHSYKAVFSATSSYATSTSATFPLTVTHAGLYPSATSASATQVSVGNYTLAATVVGAGNAAPTGTVSLLDTTNGNAVLGTTSLVAGTAGLNFSVSPLNTGGAQIVAGDFNGDGIPDLALTSGFNGTGETVIELGNGDGTFTEGQTLENGATVAVGDFNGDGKLDLAVGGPSDYGEGGTLSIYLGNGDGTFSLQSPSPESGYGASSLAVGDFNGDGIPDLAMDGYISDKGWGAVDVLLGNRDGISPNGVNIDLNYYPNTIVVGDFNGDGNLDMAVANSPLTIFLGAGDGETFTTSTLAEQTGAPFLVEADFNGDGIPDLLTGYGVLIGDGTGKFAAPLPLPAGVDAAAVAVGDFNGDGIPDLATVGGTSGKVTILYGNGDGTFTVAGSFTTGSNQANSLTTGSDVGNYLVVADFNGDGLADIAIGSTVLLQETQSSTASLNGITLTPGTGVHQVVASYSGNSSYGTSTSAPMSLTATQLSPTVSVSASPNPVVVGSSTTLMTTVSGSEAVPTGTVSFADGSTNLGQGTLASGVATFAISTLAVGSHNITATYSGDSNYTAGTGTGMVLVTGVYLSANTISFGSVIVGQTSASQSVTLSNTMSTAVSISSIVLGGANPSSFSSSNNCGTSLAAGAHCTISGKFSPTTMGGLGATVTITDNGPGSPRTVTLVGTGASPLSLSASSVSFGSEEIGTASASQSVTLTNTGNTTVSISSISVTGTNASSFVFGNNCPASLAVGANCSIHGHFAPTAEGSSTAAITIADNAVGSPQTIALSGTGLGPVVTLSTSEWWFPEELVGTSSASQPFTVTNTGTGPLSIASIAVTGADASSFVFGNDCGTSVAAGASCTIHGHFDPQLAGALTATVTITDNAPDSPQTILLNGTGSLGPEGSLSPSSLSFGPVPVGTSSPYQEVILYNRGIGNMAITSMSVTGANASSFVLENSCAGGSYRLNQGCGFNVYFSPTTAGPLTAAVTIVDSGLNSPQTLPLSGTGVGVTSVALSATSLSFGSEPLGTASASRSVTMTNTGNTALSFSGISVMGADASSFVFANNCGTSLSAEASCSIHGHFEPTIAGELTAAITITDNGVGSPQTIALSGTGLGPAASLSSSSMSFGSVKIGSQSGSQSVTLTNSGAVSLSITSIEVSGPDASSFVFANSCGMSLAAGANCSIHGHFAPPAQGALTATITITDNACNSPQKIALSGTGAPATTVSLSATSLSFGLVDVGTASPSQSVTLTNTGTGVLSINSITVSGADAGSYVFANSCGTTLMPGADCTIHGHFQPQTEGALTATIKITDNASGSPQTISLSGTGQ